MYKSAGHTQLACCKLVDHTTVVSCMMVDHKPLVCCKLVGHRPPGCCKWVGHRRPGCCKLVAQSRPGLKGSLMAPDNLQAQSCRSGAHRRPVGCSAAALARTSVQLACMGCAGGERERPLARMGAGSCDLLVHSRVPWPSRCTVAVELPRFVDSGWCGTW